ncbi:MAG TPA: VWA domain-containing protein, partial [Baekduia sp.]
MDDRAFRVRTLVLDLPAVAAAFSHRLRAAGLPVTADRTARFADALALVRPVSRRRLYWTARAALLSDPQQVAAFDATFAAVFGARDDGAPLDPDVLRRVAAAPDDRPLDERPAGPSSAASAAPPAIAALTAPAAQGRDAGDDEREVTVPTLASADEVLRAKRFDALEPDELAAIHRLMARLEIATPRRVTRRAERHRRGARIDLRRTLRGSMRTGGDPFRLARRRRRVVPRRIVMLLDISGSMEPYARAYLQFLASGAGAGDDAEAFVFATRLTRLTRALASRNPERAIQRAAEAAPDWSSGTRIGDALRE